MKLELDKEKIFNQARASLPYTVIPTLVTLALGVLIYGGRREAKGYARGYKQGSAAGYGHGCIDGFNAAADREAVQQLSKTIEKNLGSKLSAKL